MILFVCTGNICRSPFAEAMLRKALAEQGKRDVHVGSAGVGALDGTASPSALVELAARYGVDMSGHAARAVTHRILEKADKIYVMDSMHWHVLQERFPQFMHKVQRLGS